MNDLAQSHPWGIVPVGFEVSASGVFFVDSKDPRSPKRRVTSVPAWVSSINRSIDGGAWAICVQWMDRDAQVRTRSVDYASLLKRSDDLSDLAADGLLIMPGAVQLFATFLSLCAARTDLPRFRTFHSLGLHAWSRYGVPGLLHFILPNQCLVPSREALHEFELQESGQSEVDDGAQTAYANQALAVPALDEEFEEVQYLPQFQNNAAAGYKAAGTLEEWQAMIAPFHDNNLFVFALSFAFASLLTGAAGGDIVIAHLYGQSSSGKTAALQAAMSVLGIAGDPQNPSRSNVERWNSTSNGIELLLACHSGMLAAVDELGSSVAAVISVYNAASGQGKTRMTDAGQRKRQLEWRLGILSSGEISMQEKVEESNKRRAKLGELIRALDIPIESMNGEGSRVCEEQAVLVRNLKQSCGVLYGTAGPAFMQAVLDSFVTEERLQNYLVSEIDAIQAALVENAKRRRKLDPAHVRALRRFALVAVAGALASESTVLPFSAEDIRRSIFAAAEAWLEALPLLSEAEQAVESIRDHVISNFANILHYDVVTLSERPLSHIPRDQKAIFKDDLILFDKAQFAEACGGVSPKIALKFMHLRGMLSCELHKLTKRIDMAALGIRRTPFYAVIAKRLLSPEELRGVQGDPIEDAV